MRSSWSAKKRSGEDGSRILLSEMEISSFVRLESSSLARPAGLSSCPRFNNLGLSIVIARNTRFIMPSTSLYIPRSSAFTLTGFYMHIITPSCHIPGTLVYDYLLILASCYCLYSPVVIYSCILCRYDLLQYVWYSVGVGFMLLIDR